MATKKPIRRGLVLGGGGILGAAWMVGALKAVEEIHGFDPRTADYIVSVSPARSCRHCSAPASASSTCWTTSRVNR